MPKATSKCVVEFIWKNIALHYGFSSKILSDCRKNFLTPIVKQFFQMGKIKKLITSAYYLCINGKVECLMRFLKVICTG